MRSLLILALLLLPACAVLPAGAPLQETPIQVHSHNTGDVDVYVLCGDHDAQWLGRVPPHGVAAYAISPAQRRCVEGLNFFLVASKLGRGYWLGPFRPQASSAVTLVIEKYAGLSSASLIDLR
jgi:hypothetical protein